MFEDEEIRIKPKKTQAQRHNKIYTTRELAMVCDLFYTQKKDNKSNINN